LVNVSSAAELLFYLWVCRFCSQKVRTTPAKARGDENRPQLSVALTTPRLRALHRAEDIGSTLKRGVNVSSDNLSTKCSGLLLPQKYVIDEMRPDPPGCEAQGGPGLIIRPAATVGADDQPSNAGGLPLVWFHQSGQVKKYPLNCGEPE